MHIHEMRNVIGYRMAEPTSSSGECSLGRAGFLHASLNSHQNFKSEFASTDFIFRVSRSKHHHGAASVGRPVL